MRRRWGVSLAAGLLGACSLFAFAQDNKPLAETPELKLRVIPEKETFRLIEKVFTKTEFVNVSAKTLCFPKPTTDYEETYPGYVTTLAEAPDNSPFEVFLEHYDSLPPWPDRRLLSEIRSRWIKLEPSALYVTDSAMVQANLELAGTWHLVSTYHPPESAFNSASSRSRLASAAESTGCTIPHEVSSPPVSIEVVPNTNTK